MSSPLEELQGHFPVVVVGSGYGGAISASRLARAGQPVCLLERGREFHPGEYPDTLAEASEEMQLHAGEMLTGRRTALYDFRVGEDISVFMGCGLGGTSLVNANVALHPDPRVFDDLEWPAAIRADLTDGVQRGYQRATTMLQPTPLPDALAGIPKLTALSESAGALPAGRFSRPPINVTFTDRANAAGIHQAACTACGDCVSGCNFGSKNTLLMNYLPDAHAFGARIFTQVSVRYLERQDDKWVLHCQLLNTGREHFDAPLVPITADIVVLSAGTLGSTEILLRSAANGLAFSPVLGKRFTGNGDVLAFSYNGDHEVNGVGWGHRRGDHLEPVGPCITGCIDIRQTDVLNDGMIIEEGSIPGALAGALPMTFAAAAGAVGQPTGHGVPEYLRQRAREIESIVGGAHRGATHNTQTYLVMTHDDGDGELRLDDDRLRVVWPGVGKKPIFSKVNDNLLAATGPLGGSYVKDPLWTKLLHNDLVTVHPLGGCVMADDAANGVVNDKGEVYSGGVGVDTHDGLYVSDGSVIPRPLGVNPLLTISALAERCAEHIAAKNSWTIDYDKPTPAPPSTPPPTVGIEFTERMAGWLSTTPVEDYAAAATRGQDEGSSFDFILTIVSEDLEQMLNDPQHPARMVGTVRAPLIDAEPMAAVEGAFNLFVDDPSEPDLKQMRYRMTLVASGGKRYLFTGFKRIKHGKGFDMWPDTTTLYVTVHDGEHDTDPVKGRGILRISPADFARQMTTLRVLNAPNTEARLRAEARFGKAFADVLYDTYGGVVAGPTFDDPDAPPRKRRQLRVSAPELHPFTTDDGTKLLLTRHRGGPKGPVILSHGLGVASSIFTIDTIETNLLEYLFAHGYDVWLLDYRASISLPAAHTQFSGDDIAKYDYPAAVRTVCEVTGAPNVQMVAHCFGSSTFVMAMLSGLQGVRSAVCSQVGMHVVAPTLTRFKAGIHLPGVLKKLGIKDLSAHADADEGWLQKAFDKALQAFPMEAEEHCSSAVCHRITFLYSLLYEHDQLNEPTHKALGEMFGLANIRSFEHLTRMVREGKVVTIDGDDSYLPHVDRFNIPVTFIHGAENDCFLPESTELSVQLLRQRNPGVRYDRHVIPGYGHIDCIFGRDAARDVYPLILQHLDRT
jgi:cholesterol oxidase